jgi:hypothetical protein
LKNDRVLKFKSEIQNTRKYEEAPIAQNKFKRVKLEPEPEIKPRTSIS